MGNTIKLAATNRISREEWLKLRQKGIGGSDAGIIMGVNPYETIYELWLRKTNRLDPKKSNAAMQRGVYLEPLVADMFAEHNPGAKVRRANQMLQKKEIPFMLANLDRQYKLADGTKGILECKTTSSRNRKNWLENPPEYYQCQVQHYLAVTGLQNAVIAVTIGEDLEYKQYDLPRDDAFISLLIEQEERFWWHVVHDQEPDSKEFTNLRAVDELFKNGNGGAIDLSPSIESAALRYADLKSEVGSLKKELERLEALLKGELGNNEVGRLPSGIIIEWKNIIGSRFDSTALKNENDDVYKKYLKTSISRRFAVKL